VLETGVPNGSLGFSPPPHFLSLSFGLQRDKKKYVEKTEPIIATISRNVIAVNHSTGRTIWDSRKGCVCFTEQEILEA
jgi:hypothetical protein